MAWDYWSDDQVQVSPILLLVDLLQYYQMLLKFGKPSLSYEAFTTAHLESLLSLPIFTYEHILHENHSKQYQP